MSIDKPFHIHIWKYPSSNRRICRCGETQQKFDTAPSLCSGGTIHCNRYGLRFKLEWFTWVHEPFKKWEENLASDIELDKKDLQRSEQYRIEEVIRAKNEQLEMIESRKLAKQFLVKDSITGEK